MVANYIISIGFILFGSWWLYRAYAPRYRSQIAKSWPTTTAEILESNTKEDQLRTSTGNVSVAFVPTVRYSYKVNGQQYEGNRITFATIGFDFITASNIREQFLEGNQTSVSYNPDNPAESVLRPAATAGMFSRIPGFFMLIIGLVLLYFVII